VCVCGEKIGERIKEKGKRLGGEEAGRLGDSEAE
jgi:hypothetical protein